ncbi:hypothetical protein RYX36_009226 [Vicia faba]
MKDASEMSLEEDFLNLSQRKIIEEIKDFQDNMICVVLGTIKHIIHGNDWWYIACVCNKGVVVDSKRFFCPKCNKHIWTIVLRYRVKLRVIDETNSATFVLFDRYCYLLTKITCSDLIAEIDRNSVDVDDDLTAGVVQSYMIVGVIQDLNSVVKNFAGVDEILTGAHVQKVGAEDKCEDIDYVSTHIEVDYEDCIPVKRGIMEVAGDIDGGNTRILKNIKIEKD